VIEVASRAIGVPGFHSPLLPVVHAVSRLREKLPVVVQLARYTMVGGLGTAVNAGLYLLFRLVLGSISANLVALLLSTAVSTELNRRFTFEGASADRWRVWVQDLGTVLFYAFYSSAVLLLVDDLIPDASTLQETAAVTAASALGGLLRFLVLKTWVFDTHHDQRDDEVGTDDPGRAGGAGAAGAPAARVPAEQRDVAAGDRRVGRPLHGGGAGSPGLRPV
jgi:putative flippase GtrA